MLQPGCLLQVVKSAHTLEAAMNKASAGEGLAPFYVIVTQKHLQAFSVVL